MSLTAEWTVIHDKYPSKRFITNYSNYIRSNGRVQKNVINAVDFLTRVDCSGAILVVVADWSFKESLIVLKLFPELSEVHVWTRIRSHEVSDDRVKIRYNRPGQLSYSNTSKPTLLICSIRSDEEVEAQNLVLSNVNPEAASLKFRPTQTKGKRSFSFFAGTVSTVCYSQTCSIEAKIFVTRDSEITKYDANKFRSKMFFYNTEVRTKVIDGLSFDEYYCLSILTDYISVRNLDKSPMNLWSDVTSMLM